MSTDNATVALSLIAHTNVGKTTLARTLLGSDVGEIRDAPHVTTEATRHPMIETAQGDALVLWDTPGFADSARLARRLAAQGNPIGWFLAQVWDRFRDQPLYFSQLAVRNVRDEADVVLYLVNAAEAPADAGYLAPELEVLQWIGRPVIVLLNQTGPPRPRAEEEAEEARWRVAVGQRPFVHGILTLDAFARCWVQEIVLLRVIGRSIEASKQVAFGRLVAAWQARRTAQFDASMAALAQPIVHAATDKVTLPNAGVTEAVRSFVGSIVTGRAPSDARQQALGELAASLAATERASSERLLVIHGLEGRAADEARERMIDALHADEPVSESKAAVVGGVFTGALAGLKADLVAGGLTFGAGTLIGALAGAAGGAGLARGFNLVRGQTETQVRWTRDVLDQLVGTALLRYLAVAHFGRGRGEWTATQDPLFWRDAVQRILDERRDALAALWAQSRESSRSGFEDDVRALLQDAGRALLDALYPGALDVADDVHRP